MSKDLSSKQRMIDATADLLRRQGYHATGLNQIVREAKAPKGSLYFHFPGGKEELAVTALASSSEGIKRDLTAIVMKEPDPRRAVEGVIDYFAKQLESTGYLAGCPMATVALEATATSDELQQVCSRHYAEWQQLVAAYLVTRGFPADSADELATTTLAAFEGGLLLSRAHRNLDPLRAVGRQLSRLVELYLPATD